MADRPPRPDPRREGNPAEPPRRTGLTGIVTGQTSPARREVPPPLPPAHRPQPRPTMTGAPAPPAPQSAPEPPRPSLRDLSDLGTLEPVPGQPGRLETLRGLGDVNHPSLPPKPTRSVSPAPSSAPAVRVETSLGKVEFRRGFLSKLAPWLAPLLLSALGALGGAIVGYYEGLARAGARVAAIEEAARLNAEADARLKTRTERELNRAFTVIDDHDSRLPKLERRLDQAESRLPKIEGLRNPP